MQVAELSPLDHLQKQVIHWRDRALKAEYELKLQRELRRAPVLKPIDKAIIEEFRHTETYGTVKDHDGNTRANFTTIANRLHTSPDTVKRSADRMEKLGLVTVHEQAGPLDQYERKYIHVDPAKLENVRQLQDVNKVVPKHGGNRYTCQCGSERVKVHTVKTFHCLDCDHVTLIEETEVIQDNGHKAQKQLAFDGTSGTKDAINVQETQDAQKQLAFQDDTDALDELPTIEDATICEPEKQIAEHIVYTLLSTQFAEPPKLLLDRKIWVVWRYEQDEGKEKLKKVPYQAKGRGAHKAMPNEPKTWGSYADAKKKYDEAIKYNFSVQYDGIGIMCDGTFTVLDYDHCIVDGGINEEVKERLGTFASYAEISPSDTGVHQIVLGTIPQGRKTSAIEMYCTGRFLTWTGNHILGLSDTIEPRQDELDALYEQITPKREAKPRRATVYTSAPQSDDSILEKARSSGNSEKFIRLYDDGDMSGYGSQSEADLALCGMLAYWCNYDEQVTDRLFRASKLMRDKWDRSVGRGETYGERTIIRACERMSA